MIAKYARYLKRRRPPFLTSRTVTAGSWRQRDACLLRITVDYDARGKPLTFASDHDRGVEIAALGTSRDDDLRAAIHFDLCWSGDGKPSDRCRRQHALRSRSAGRVDRNGLGIRGTPLFRKRLATAEQQRRHDENECGNCMKARQTNQWHISQAAMTHETSTQHPLPPICGRQSDTTAHSPAASLRHTATGALICG